MLRLRFARIGWARSTTPSRLTELLAESMLDDRIVPRRIPSVFGYIIHKPYSYFFLLLSKMMHTTSSCLHLEHGICSSTSHRTFRARQCRQALKALPFALIFCPDPSAGSSASSDRAENNSRASAAEEVSDILDPRIFQQSLSVHLRPGWRETTVNKTESWLCEMQGRKSRGAI